MRNKGEREILEMKYKSKQNKEKQMILHHSVWFCTSAFSQFFHFLEKGETEVYENEKKDNERKEIRGKKNYYCLIE